MPDDGRFALGGVVCPRRSQFGSVRLCVFGGIDASQGLQGRIAVTDRDVSNAVCEKRHAQSDQRGWFHFAREFTRKIHFI